MRVLPFGERAVLAEADSLVEVLELHAALAASRPRGVIDLVPAARTVLVHVDPRVLPVAAARAWIEGAGAAPANATDAVVFELPVVYDGADLTEAADLLGVGSGELVRRHAAVEWTVAFTGFAPGFGYLVSADWPFDVPRRATPRTRVPAGAVGLAGEFSGAYPRETPGGWQLIGTTPVALFDPDAVPPALLTPGARVRFAPVPPSAAGASGLVASHASVPLPARLQPCIETAGANGSLDAPVQSRGLGLGRGRGRGRGLGIDRDLGGGAAPAGIRVVEPGLLATVQDQGRPGHAAEGVGVSGAADRAALRAANRLVGNDEHAAGIEVTMGGFRAVALADTWFAVTGARGTVRLDGQVVDPYAAHAWPADAELHLDWFDHGVRGYLAVRGGVDVPRVVGSRSTDTLAALGPSPLARGAELPLGVAPAAPVPPLDHYPWTAPGGEIEIELTPGPRSDWFGRDALQTLFDAVWTVSNEADRVGIRLDGPALERAGAGELPSEGMLPGAVQVPPSGLPVIFGPDGPVTGGYPVIAVVADASRDRLAQARPGTRVRFRHARVSG